jgi:hypothetical protein
MIRTESIDASRDVDMASETMVIIFSIFSGDLPSIIVM